MLRLLTLLVLALFLEAESVLAQRYVPPFCKFDQRAGLYPIGATVNMKVLDARNGQFYADAVTVVCYTDLWPNHYYLEDAQGLVFIINHETLSANLFVNNPLSLERD